MRALFAFIFRFRASFLFVFLELIAFWMIIRNNHYQNALFFNTANYYVASSLRLSNNIEEYFSLKEVNESLAKENVRLHEELLRAKQANESVGAVKNNDIINKYEFQLARIVNKTTQKTHNYLTIEKGRSNGIIPDMGVISANGIVGKVKDVSGNYARVISILHTDITISAQIKANKYVSYIQWDGRDARFVKMKDVPTPIKVQVGDTIVTSGYNSFFPQGAMIGVVEKVGKVPEATFHDIDVRLSTDFNSLTYVYVVGDALKQERDSLERKSEKNQ